jgi:PmbA protein
MADTSTLSLNDTLAQLLDAARKAGAEAADASVSGRESLSVEVRLGALEHVEREESRSIALRALIGKRQAAAVSSDLSPAALQALAERVVAMARIAPEDPYCGLLAPEDRAGPPGQLPAPDDKRLSAAALEDLAQAMETAALAVPGVTNSAGASAGWSASSSAYAASDGFFAAQEGGSYGISVQPLAERDGLKERDYEYRQARRFVDLPQADALGRIAGERTIARLGAEKIPSTTSAVIIENRIAARLIGPYLGAISGAAIARGVSFLRDKLGERIFAENVQINEDPLRPYGLASRAFDGEGAAARPAHLAKDGVLQGWLCNAAAARQLGLKSTGHASFGHGGPPGVTTSNVTVVPPPGAPATLAGLMKQAGRGLVVTEMFSPSLNANTGDYSVGVAGYWFDAGERAQPVSEVTIAGNLIDFYARLIVGGDLERRGSLDSPSLLIEGVAIAGK